MLIITKSIYKVLLYLFVMVSDKEIIIGQYKINRDKAMKAVTSFDFLNPAEDFIGIIECLGNIRHIEKRGEMKQDLDVIDVRIIAGYETREVEEKTSTSDGTIVRQIKTIKKEYHNEPYSLILSKAVLLSKFKKLQEQFKDLKGKIIVIIGLGKAEDKNYYDYYVETEEKAKDDGILEVIKKI